MKKRVIAILICLVMAASLLPATALATGPDVIDIVLSSQSYLISADIIAAIKKVDEDGDTVRLTRRMELNSSISIDCAYDFTLDLNGYTISVNGKSITLEGSGTLTITDSKIDGITDDSGQYFEGYNSLDGQGLAWLPRDGGGKYERDDKLFHVKSSASLILKDVAVNFNNSYAAAIENSGTVTIQDGASVIGSNSYSNGVIYTKDNGRTVMEGGTVKNTTRQPAFRVESSSYYSTTGTLEVSGGTILGDCGIKNIGIVMITGGNISTIDNNKTLTITGGTVKGGTYPAIYNGNMYSGAGTVTIGGTALITSANANKNGYFCTILNNYGIYTNDGSYIDYGTNTVTITGGTVSNTATGSGSIYAINNNGSNCKVNISGGEISAPSGIAVYNNDAEVNITGNTKLSGGTQAVSGIVPDTTKTVNLVLEDIKGGTNTDGTGAASVKNTLTTDTLANYQYLEYTFVETAVTLTEDVNNLRLTVVNATALEGDDLILVARYDGDGKMISVDSFYAKADLAISESDGTGTLSVNLDGAAKVKAFLLRPGTYAPICNAARWPAE